MNYLSLFIAIVPIVVIGLYFYHKDNIKEPKKMIIKLFFSGFLSAIITIIISFISLIFFPDFLSHENLNILGVFIYSFIFVSLVEELSKWLMIKCFAYQSKEFDQIFDIILYSVFVGLGFALFENLIYVFTNDNSLQVALFRSITAVPAHASFQIFMGYYLGQKKLYEKNNLKKANKYHLLSIIIPILLHGTYDFLILSGLELLIIIFLIFVILLFVFSIKRSNTSARNNFLINDELSNLENKNNTFCINCKEPTYGNYCSKCGQKN